MKSFHQNTYNELCVFFLSQSYQNEVSSQLELLGHESPESGGHGMSSADFSQEEGRHHTNEKHEKWFKV